MSTLAAETIAPRLDARAPADLVARAEEVIAPTYRRADALFTDGLGCWLFDAEGRRYLDMTSGIGVTALGHRPPALVDALRDAAGGLWHTSNLFHTEAPTLLAEALVERSFAERVFFANSGTEAVEGALKFARRAAGAERAKLVSFTGCFHGRTMGALSVTDRPSFQEPFRPLLGDVHIAPWDDAEGLAAIDGRTAAAIIEPVQGEGGVRPASDAWLQAVRARCDEVGALLIVDEVQCGVGRTGTLWAHEPSGITPDIMALAKPLAGGLPIGAVLLGPRAAAAVQVSDHGSTFGGGPIVTRVALALLREVGRPAFLEAVRAKGARLRARLASLVPAHAAEVRGRGLMIGLEVRAPAADIVRRAREEGLLVLSAGPTVVRLLPPLNTPDDLLDLAADRLSSVLASIAGDEA